MGAVTVGLDLGQKRDFTALSVIEAEWRPREDGQGRESHYLCRFLERQPLGTSYPKVAERVAAVCAGIAARSLARPLLYVDATGVGQPVVDVLRDARVQATLIPVYFTYGDRRTVELDDRGQVRAVKLGKGFLVSRLQALLQSGRLHLPRSAEADALGRELLDYEIKVSEQGNDTYGAFKTGAHDDLTTALGLATQEEPRGLAGAVFAQGVARGWSPSVPRPTQRELEEAAAQAVPLRVVVPRL